MKNTKIAVGVLALVLAFVALGCTSTNVKSAFVGEYNMIPKIAGKDFVVLGHVSVSATEEINVSPLRFRTEHKGERVTFDLLLQEAIRLYPEVTDIINVRIDRIVQGDTSPLDFFIGSHQNVRYIGNALAVMYTDALPEGEWPIGGKSKSLPQAGLRPPVRKKFSLIGTLERFVDIFKRTNTAAEGVRKEADRTAELFEL